MLGTDPADPRFVFDLAASADTAFAGYDVSFAAGPRPPAFLIRQTVDSGSFANGNTAFVMNNGSVVDWNTSGGTVSSSGSWQQSSTEVQGWWMLGLMCSSATVSGTITIGSRIQCGFLVSTLDPVSNLFVAPSGDGGSNYSQLFQETAYVNDGVESNSGGDWFCAYVTVPVYRATITAQYEHFDPGASALKKVVAGSVFWGIRLGDV